MSFAHTLPAAHNPKTCIDLAEITSLSDKALPARLLTPDRLLDLIMRRSLSSPQMRCFQDGIEVHPARFLDDSTSRRGQILRTVDIYRLRDMLAAGCTMVLDHVDFFDPTLEVVCRALQWWSGELVQVNAYLTTKAAAGFPAHWDDHDVLIVQLAGDKDWEVRGCSRPVPMYRDAEPNDTPPDHVLWSGTLPEGDVLHIPRGYWHCASRTNHDDGYSLHATFGITKRNGVAWLMWLADVARRQQLFREDLLQFADPEARRSQAEELVAALAVLAKDNLPGEFLNDRERTQSSARHVPMLDFLPPPHKVVCVTSFRPRIHQRDTTVEVIAAGKKITFAAAALPALTALLSGQPVDVASLADVTGLNVARLVTVLLEERLCAPLTPELSLGYTGLVTNAHLSKPLTA